MDRATVMDRATATEMARDFVLSGMLIDSKEKGGDAVRTVIDTANAIFAENT